MTLHKGIAALLILAIGVCSASRERWETELAACHRFDQIKELSGEGNLFEPAPYNDVKNDVKFILYSRGKGYVGELIVPGDLNSLKSSHFSSEKPTKVLIHGFIDDSEGEMITSIRDRYLLSEDVNVLIVDWSKIAMSVNYIRAAMRTVDVGIYLSELIEFLVTQGADMNSFHLIGHSLGAHVAGMAGKSVRPGMVSRITGLDPALPGFDYIKFGYRLHETDAIFVDCIHTCGELLAFFQPLCHVDFYPNGGLHPQPGCSRIDFGKCSHFRAFKFFAESITKNHKFPSYRCSSISPDSRSCEQLPSNEVILMGNWVNNRTRGLYYVYTNSDYPYAPVVE